METYKQLIGREQSLTLDKVIKISERLLPDNKRQKPWKCVNHGINLLTSEDELNAYMLAYGEIHRMKCRAAFQNFPFDKIYTNIEIVDWGCGQGLASLVFMEMLSERRKEQFVKKISLIEPSSAALERAQLNLCQKVNGEADIVSINKYLPSDSETPHNEITEFESTQSVTVHIFSNILDIPTVNLHKLSKIISSNKRMTYVVCIGPKNPNSWRINAFEGYFHYEKSNLFTDIEQSFFAYTQRTNHPITCKTKGFYFDNKISKWNGTNRYQDLEGKKLDGQFIDDYDSVSTLFKGMFPQSLLSVYEKIQDQLDTEDKLFIRPNINGDTPDLVLFKPQVGIVLFNVNDTDLSIELKKEKEKEKEKADEKEEDKKIQNEKKELYSAVEVYANRLIDLHIASLREKIIEDSKYMSIIKKVTVFTNSSKQDIQDFFNFKHPYISLLSGNDIGNDLFHSIEIDRTNPYFTDELAASFLHQISSRWHPYRDGERINLSNEQKELVKSTASAHQKIKGVAGSGKTQVMAFRAVNAMIRTGRPILILTFNITLRNYIKYRLNQISADFSWNNVTIINYHEFFNSQALNVGRRVRSLDAYEDTNYFMSAKVQKYSAIFIDEVQDFQKSWLQIVHDTFLDKDGEFVVFGDKAQNVFHRKSDTTDNEPVIPAVNGRWNQNLNKSHRFLNGKILNLTQKFNAEFIEKGQYVNLELEMDNDRHIKYALIPGKTSEEKLGKWCMEIVKKFGLSVAKTAVLASTSDLLQTVDEEYRKYSGKKTEITFASKEQYDMIRYKSAASYRLNDEALSRTKKLHFTMDCDCLKLSTIYSFKGWEADNIILFIQKPEPVKKDSSQPKLIYEAPAKSLSPEIIYTAITRTRKNLFIFNFENEMYDEFFKKNIEQ